MELLEWYNLIFVAPVVLAGIYLILSATGIGDHPFGLAEGDMDTDADVDADMDMDADVGADLEADMDADMDVGADVDADVDTGIDADADVGGDIEHDLDVGHDMDMDHDVQVEAGHEIGHDFEADHDLEHDHHADAEHVLDSDHPAAGQDTGTRLLWRALSVLGFGRVPFSVLLTSMMVVFGAAGLIANGLFGQIMPWGWGPVLYFWPSLAIALICAFGLTGKVARGLDSLMPTSETYAEGPEGLVGRVGVVVYGIPEGGRGVVSARDAGGTVHQVAGRCTGGAIPRGTEVILVRYRPETDEYDVAASPL